MPLIALDPDSIELMKLSKRLRKAKKESDRLFIIKQIRFYQDRIIKNKLETEKYFEKK